MAEAHQAVHYSDSIIHEHTDANHDQEVLQLVWQSGLRSLKKRIAQTLTKFRNGVYPAHVESLWIIMGIVMGLHFATQNVPFDFVNYVIKFMPDSSPGWQTVTCCLVGFFCWIFACLTMRYILKLLLIYKGYMFETRGKRVSLKTKVWGILVKFLVKWNSPSLYSFQGSLPRLPVPSVKDTMTRYLRSVRPLLDDATYEKVRKEADEFANGIGKKLQRYLILKSWWSSNYVSDWWEEYVYLRSRGPLMVGSNYYGTDFFTRTTLSQSSRAANLVWRLMIFRRNIDRQQMKPIMAQGLVPLCSAQYERIFNTARIPGIEGDKIVHYNDTKHIIVLHKGCYYKMTTHHKGKIMNPLELQHQIEQILNMNHKTSHGEEFVASLTAWERTKWAQAREKYFSNGVNKSSLFLVESAAFVLVLEDGPFEFSINSSPDEFGVYGRQLLHGKGYDRWFDKSFNLIVSNNGRFGMNAEHTWADAPVMAHMFEELCYDDLSSYDEHGNPKGVRGIIPPTPTRLNWEFNEQLLKTIDDAYDFAQKVIENVDHQIVIHDAFGKGFIKTCHLSPDAFIQMALQLAYYRDYGKFSLTYEASMTRLYREGRTETVRPCTIESAAWVKSMENTSSTAKERVKLLQEACKRHQQGYLEAMCGRGIDRHLFCLYVVSKYLEVESPFLKEVITEPWRLSTSQTPHGQTPKIDLKKYPDLIVAGGGFGPVSQDGYAVSYIISGDHYIFFHISSTKSCSLTNTDRFGKRVVRAMADIKSIFDDFNLKKDKTSNGVHS